MRTPTIDSVQSSGGYITFQMAIKSGEKILNFDFWKHFDQRIEDFYRN